MNKRRLYWLFQIFGWSFYAVINGVVASFVWGGQKVSLTSYVPLLTEAIFFLLITHTFRLIIKRYKWLDYSMLRLSPRIVLSALTIGLSIYLLRIGVSYVLGIYPANSFNFQYLGGNTFYNTLVVFIWTLFYFIFQYFERYNQSLKHEAEFHQIELNNLKSQLNPHFIFNSLNSIRALVDENPAKSKSAITQLSNILRNSLTTDQKRVTRFEDELSMVKDYLSLETIRYEERLETEMEIHPDCYDYNVPPFMLQTLVENGIKHGIAKLKQGGKIGIKSYVENDRLKLEIRNTGKLSTKNGVKKPKGLGVSNTRRRLKLIYGDDAQFSIQNEEPNTVLTQVILPKVQAI